MSGVTWGGSMAGINNPDAVMGYQNARRGPDGKVRRNWR